AAERRAAAAAAESARKSSSSGGGSSSGGSGGRRIGGYAPLPIELASSGPGLTDRGQPGGGRGPARPAPSGRETPTNPAQRRPPLDGYGRNIPGREGFTRPVPGREGYDRTTPSLNPDGQIQNPALSAPFDPTRM